MNLFQVIADQARKLGDLLFNPETSTTYKNAALLTWEILKESARLVWLLFCVLLICVDWLWKNSFQVGQSTRSWYDTIEDPKSDHFLPAAGKILSEVSQNLTSSIFSQAREQLGLPESDAVALELPASKEPAKVTVTSPVAATKTVSLEEESN